MILTFVNKGESGPEGINYLFSEKDANGKERNPPAELLEGDILLTKYLIENNSRIKKYSSYALSFRDNEKVTDEQLKEIVQSVRDTFCTGLGSDRINILAVKHTDKGNTEVHLIINDEDMLTGRRFNPWPPGERSQKLQQDFCACWNHRLGFEQVVSNPFKASFSRFDAKVPKERRKKFLQKIDEKEAVKALEENKDSNQRREKLSSITAEAVMAGKINNRNDLVKFLERNNCRITRKGKDYLSIILPGKEKPIRFKGGCFKEDVDYRSLIAEHNTASKHLRPDQFRKVEARLDEAMVYKRELHAKIYAPKEKKIRLPKTESVKIKAPQQIKPNNKVKPKEQRKQTIQPVVKSNSNVSKKQKNFNNFRSIGISSSLGTHIAEKIGSVELQLTALYTQLSNAPNSKRAEIEQKIFELKFQLTVLQQQQIEDKKAELNRDKKDKFKI
ncbi:relaxase/mobilization nuclease domain-containing protein [Noviherbaspirillum pedocola]|uniref:Relaxase/mobilization nuclease domain-containing protein n=1 Tax=Noviherbaspirillum pedocola TaxID=2801341 RepID=A0A934SVY0_9BURK|nr:relaxase/mobilization nuclease domain-containing protein [Noviherbaspirillum pedocola]MBK4733694.1 relaxase/mobilization nuclease domain-containing protein [Noviherbaspirillum pedocola]